MFHTNTRKWRLYGVQGDYFVLKSVMNLDEFLMVRECKIYDCSTSTLQVLNRDNLSDYQDNVGCLGTIDFQG